MYRIQVSGSTDCTKICFHATNGLHIVGYSEIETAAGKLKVKVCDFFMDSC